MNDWTDISDGQTDGHSGPQEQLIEKKCIRYASFWLNVLRHIASWFKNKIVAQNMLRRYEVKGKE